MSSFLSSHSVRISGHEAFLGSRKFLVRGGILFDIRDRESDADYCEDEEWSFAAWCGPRAAEEFQAAFAVAKNDGSLVDSGAANNTSMLPTLYGASAHGKRKLWRVRVEARGETAVIISEHGYEDTKIVVAERIVEKGKNIGRSNETTPYQQAVSEAQSAWNKKRDAGYAPEGHVVAVAGSSDASDTDVASAHAAHATTAVVAVPLPMLAQDFNKRGKSIVFPCFAQRKLDGVRCVAMSNGMYSRNGKKFPHLQHILQEVAGILGHSDLVLDGELYSDELTFQEIVGLVKKETLRGDDAAKMHKIHLCVYDIIVEGVSNVERKSRLEEIFASHHFQHLRLLPTDMCERKEDMAALHARYVSEGYEGLMVRNTAAMYRMGVRSVDLQKYKEFEDAEYVVSGFKDGEGAEKGCVIWICRTPKGQEFAVRPRGTHEERAAILKEAATYVGKELTVRYQELTTDGIPRFPVGIAFRNYE